MSTDYDLKCKNCDETIKTVASGSIAYGDKLWTGELEIEMLRYFLFNHRGHNLVFDDFTDDDAG